MNLLLPLLSPLGIWESFMGALDAMMQPIYWVISGILVGFHWLWSRILDPNAGWTWVLAIVSLTVVVRTALIPLFVRQINSARKMQMLGPKMKALQDKYGSDRERLGQETMKLYKEEGVNPAASCLPLFLQMPIFIGLFNVLNFAAMGTPLGYFFTRENRPSPSDPNQTVNPLIDSLRNADIFGAHISGRFSDNLAAGLGPTQFVAAVLIIGMTVTLFVTQLQMMRKNMPPEALTGPMAQQQKIMLYTFPLIYLITGVSIPIGVMIYWFASNLWTLGQQWILIHNSPSPNTPAFIDWQERMKAKGKDPEAIMRKRLGMDRRPKATVSDDPTKVARQNTTRSTRGSDATASEKATFQQPPARHRAGSREASSDRTRVQRQQPNRQTRANRKSAQPRRDSGAS